MLRFFFASTHVIRERRGSGRVFHSAEEACTWRGEGGDGGRQEHLVAEHVVEHAEVHAPLQALGEVLLPRRGSERSRASAPQEGQRQRQLEDALVKHGDQVVLLSHDATVQYTTFVLGECRRA